MDQRTCDWRVHQGPECPDFVFTRGVFIASGGIAGLASALFLFSNLFRVGELMPPISLTSLSLTLSLFVHPNQKFVLKDSIRIFIDGINASLMAILIAESSKDDPLFLFLNSSTNLLVHPNRSRLFLLEFECSKNDLLHFGPGVCV